MMSENQIKSKEKSLSFVTRLTLELGLKSLWLHPLITFSLTLGERETLLSFICRS